MASRGNQQPLAIELLESDHRKVEMLFDQYEEGKDGDEEAKRQLAERICAELTVHAQVEEELFYPWCRENIDDEEMEMVEEAYVEHASAKDLIAQIQGATSVDAAFDAKVKVLSEYIKHQVKEEANELFEDVQAGPADELDELGQEMASRKSELAEENGLVEDDASEAAMAGKGGRADAGDSAQRRSR